MRASALRLLIAVSVVGVFVVACSKDAAVVPAGDGAAIVASALAQQNARLSAVRDYAVEGEVKDLASNATLKFRYAMQQPSYSVGDLLDAAGNRTRSFIFDGKVLAIVDEGQKTVLRQDLSHDEEATLLMLHEIFGQFVCEGWRPPLLKPQGMVGSEAGNNLVLDVPVVDEKVATQRLTLSKQGAFVKKELLDKAGTSLVSTTVLEDLNDDGTHLVFPKRWSHSEGGSTQEVTLTKFAINAGVDPARFSTATPAGFTERGTP